MKAFSRHSLVMLSRLFSLRLTRCQVNDCKPGCTPAHPEQRRSRAKAQHTEWTHVVSTAPPQTGGEEFSECTWPIPGARSQSGPLTKGTKSFASMVHGWIFGCLRASEKFLYIRIGPNTSLRGTGTKLPVVHVDLQAWEIVCSFAAICSQARRFRALPRGSETRWHGHTARLSRRNGWRSSWTTSRTG